MSPQRQENIIEHEENIIKIVRQTLSEQRFEGNFVFDPILIIPDVDFDDDDIIRVIIVVDSDVENPRMGPGFTPKLIGRIEDYLQAAGMNHFPIPYYIGKWEWPDYKRRMRHVIP